MTWDVGTTCYLVLHRRLKGADRLKKHFGYAGKEKKRPRLVQLQIVGVSRNGWRRLRHMDSGVEINTQNPGMIFNSKLDAIYYAIRDLITDASCRHAAGYYLRRAGKSTKGNADYQSIGPAIREWLFDDLWDLYGLWNQHAERIESE